MKEKKFDGKHLQSYGVTMMDGRQFYIAAPTQQKAVDWVAKQVKPGFFSVHDKMNREHKIQQQYPLIAGVTHMQHCYFGESKQYLDTSRYHAVIPN